MTRKEAEKYIRSGMCKNCNIYSGGGKCLDNCKVIEAIKALKQGSILDKVRVEIRRKMRFDSFNEGIVSFYDISQIFNKYKTESEE